MVDLPKKAKQLLKSGGCDVYAIKKLVEMQRFAWPAMARKFHLPPSSLQVPLPIGFLIVYHLGPWAVEEAFRLNPSLFAEMLEFEGDGGKMEIGCIDVLLRSPVARSRGTSLRFLLGHDDVPLSFLVRGLAAFIELGHDTPDPDVFRALEDHNRLMDRDAVLPVPEPEVVKRFQRCTSRVVEAGSKMWQSLIFCVVRSNSYDAVSVFLHNFSGFECENHGSFAKAPEVDDDDLGNNDTIVGDTLFASMSRTVGGHAVRHGCLHSVSAMLDDVSLGQQFMSNPRLLVFALLMLVVRRDIVHSDIYTRLREARVDWTDDVIQEFGPILRKYPIALKQYQEHFASASFWVAWFKNARDIMANFPYFTLEQEASWINHSRSAVVRLATEVDVVNFLEIYGRRLPEAMVYFLLGRVYMQLKNKLTRKMKPRGLDDKLEAAMKMVGSWDWRSPPALVVQFIESACKFSPHSLVWMDVAYRNYAFLYGLMHHPKGAACMTRAVEGALERSSDLIRLATSSVWWAFAVRQVLFPVSGGIFDLRSATEQISAAFPDFVKSLVDEGYHLQLLKFIAAFSKSITPAPRSSSFKHARFEAGVAADGFKLVDLPMCAITFRVLYEITGCMPHQEVFYRSFFDSPLLRHAIDSLQWIAEVPITDIHASTVQQHIAEQGDPFQTDLARSATTKADCVDRLSRRCVGTVALLACVMRDFKTADRRSALPTDLVTIWDDFLSAEVAPALKAVHNSFMMQHFTFIEQRTLSDMLCATELEIVPNNNMLSCRAFMGSMMESPTETQANIREGLHNLSSSPKCGLPGCCNSGSKKCGSCRVEHYCCQSHQKKDWHRHKLLCSNFRQHSSPSVAHA